MIFSTQEAPPLMPALSSGRYQIKCTQLADLPVPDPLYDLYVAVQHHKIYVTGDHRELDDVKYKIYVYNINTDQWGQLPPPSNYYGIPHIIGGRLAIIGGRLTATKKRTNKVSTFDEDSQTWRSYYPDLLSVRSKPGVVSHLEHVIVAGGGIDDYKAQDGIEVLNWTEKQLQWRNVSIKLPVPMWGFTPTISDDHLLIVGYRSGDMTGYNGVYKIPVANITTSINQQHNNDTPTSWLTLSPIDLWFTAIVPSSTPPVVVGGVDKDFEPTADIKMYDNSNNSWKKIGSLLSARYHVAIAAIYDNAFIVVGGSRCTDSEANSTIYMSAVELVQAELLH